KQAVMARVALTHLPFDVAQCPRIGVDDDHRWPGHASTLSDRPRCTAQRAAPLTSGGMPTVMASRAISTMAPSELSPSAADIESPVRMWSDTVLMASARRPNAAASV